MLKKEGEKKNNTIAQWRKRYTLLYEEFYKRNRKGDQVRQGKFKPLNSS
jgi:hypothetical protein